MNEADSEIVRGLLSDNGYSMVKEPDNADVILLNTCAVRERAEERIFGRVGELARFKHSRPEVIIGVLGCMAQHLKDNLLESSRFIDIVAGPDAYRRLPDLIAGAEEDRLVDVRLDRTELYSGIVPARREGITAWITVQRGCDKCCSFCIVPAVRGRERCIPLEDVVTEAEKLALSGVREVTLLGQTVNSYHDGKHDFADLLDAISAIPDLARIRFTSPYPTDFTDKTIAVMAANDKVARHVHLPLQSANSEVLERMRRRYTIDEFDCILGKLREKIPGVAISTDIIVGFPDETDEQFRDTLEYMARERFDFAFMFKYSRRSQTSAWRWEDSISEEIKRKRLRMVIDQQERITAEIMASRIGDTVSVLVEGASKKEDGQLFGRTSDFKQVVFPGEGAKLGDMVDIRISASTGHTLSGERVKALV